MTPERSVFRVEYRRENRSRDPNSGLFTIVRRDTTIPENDGGMYGRDMQYGCGITYYAAFVAFQRIADASKGRGQVIEFTDDRLVIDYDLDAIATTNAGT